MRWFLLVILVYGLIPFAVAQTGQQVIYGERYRYFSEVNGVVRVFLDRQGDFYPEVIIPDTALLNNNASIQSYFAAHPDAFVKTATQYNLQVTGFSEQHFAALQEKIIGQLVDRINTLDQQRELFLLIHGFRKPLVPQQWSSSSKDDYNNVRSSITSRYAPDQAPQFVEVYWDGTFDCCIGRKAKVNKRIFQLFEDVAQVQATRTGYALRQLVEGIEREQLNIITHSLGAQVGVSIVSNTYDERIDSTLQSLPTPAQPRVNLCLLAPAISKEPFFDYDERTTTLDLTDEDNYRLSVLYNKKDFVLRKRVLIFGPGPRKYGNTSLGCNCQRELNKLEDYFLEHFPNSSLSLQEAAIGGTHRFWRYVESEAFSSFLSERVR
ncbi:MAG: hypothetical protein AAFO02_05770 [Bacteroidota bacterium]